MSVTGRTKAQHSHWGRKTVGRGLFCTIQQARAQGNLIAVSDGANLRIPPTRLLKRNERYTTINLKIDNC
ncbi:unnamed protein product [Protopolystoma xenopodis]|uniref:Uncharacterized protein n=1 Tax=Protopolystoma xenopodis TaxID=117903 RepID=A0A3S5A3F0_9PLAT|nr:unnamed protein product [Protopolystoma xenopodis]